MKKLLVALTLFTTVAANAQGISDTIPKTLDSVFITSFLNNSIIKGLPDVQGTYIFSGKKNEIIPLTQIDADITNKTGRQVFVKVPGIFVYDMDGSGNQINVAARGLDPHRGWEFNIRKDNVITNSDMYGYPASHYSMPLESIDHIELVRGTGSLQYGAQFGGMLNYVSKQGDSTKKISFENISSAGSFKQMSTYNAVGGTVGKLQYYTYFYRKSRDGYRENEHTDSEAESVMLNYSFTPRMSLRAEWSRSTYRYRIPGPLTDSMFHADPRQSTRSRNYFSPDIHVPSLTFKWDISPNTKLQLISSALLGRRSSVLYDKPTNVKDTIVTATQQYNNRQVDIDRFNSYTAELRLLHQYKIGRSINTVAAGVQYMHNKLRRTQLGKGTTGSDYDLTLVDHTWGRDLYFKTQNIAVFAENNIAITKQFSINVGARVEVGATDLSGKIVYYPENQIPVRIEHKFPLFGASFSYKPVKFVDVYGGWSQAYRPMVFKDLIPSSTFEKIDPNIQDADGYNLELGFRGNWKFLHWDVSGYLMQYNNRFGTLALTDNSGSFYTWRTNIGNSLTKGVEMLIQVNWFLTNKTALTIFTSTTLMDARYTNAKVKSGNNNIDIRGNRVESAPAVISRNGISFKHDLFNFSALYSYTAKTYADALNTEIPPAATGAVGLVPSYGLFDMNAGVKLSKNIDLRANLNNVFNKQYFTKRPLFYPGPGVWPSEGRSFNMSVSVKI